MQGDTIEAKDPSSGKFLEKGIYKFSDVKVKKVVLLSFTCLCLILALFSTVLTRNTEKIFYPAVEFKGYEVIVSLISGGITYYQYGVEYLLKIPYSFSIFYLFTILLMFFLVIWQAITLNKESNKKSNYLLGTLLLATAILVLFLYLGFLCLDCFTAINIKNEQVKFYSLYEVNIFLLGLSFLLLLGSYIQFSLKVEKVRKVKKYWFLYLMLVIPTVYFFFFEIVPIVYQILLGFKDYTLGNGIAGSEWVGIKNFKSIFADPYMLGIIWRTIWLSLVRLVFNIVPSVILALMIYELGMKRLSKTVQALTYIPHFFSWVIIYSIATALLSPQGIINAFRSIMFDAEPIDFLVEGKYFYPIIIVSSVWKGIGWGTILYLASLSSVDPALYEAAALDGAGPFSKMKYITFPALIPVLVFQTILALGNILRGAGGEQLLLFANNAVKDKALVIDTWLVWFGLQGKEYGVGAAMAFFQSVIGVGMVVGANKLSLRLVGRGLY